MHYIVTYDISEDKVRSKISKILENFGDRVQYSVFELAGIDEVTFKKCFKLLSRMSKTKFERSDSVRIYPITSHLKAKVQILGNTDKPPLNNPSVYVY